VNGFGVLSNNWKLPKAADDLTWLLEQASASEQVQLPVLDSEYIPWFVRAGKDNFPMVGLVLLIGMLDLALHQGSAVSQRSHYPKMKDYKSVF
jgi:hypothetical protein